MSTAHVNDIDIYYEVHGEGPNLVLIEGTGYHLWMWYKQLPELSKHFRTLVYDNRGVGRSDKPPGPYTHEQNADDLAGMLDHLGWERTHVLGVSMGGFIAQEFALKYPQRLDRLVLVATGFGGPNMVAVPPEAVKALTPDPSLSPEEKIRVSMPLAFANHNWPQEHAEEFDQIVTWRLQYPQPPEAAIAQMAAMLTFNTEERLPDIEAPTLVMAGSGDTVVPPENARLLAERIPHAQLDILEGAGHVCLIECPERFNHDVIEFLSGEGTGD